MLAGALMEASSDAIYEHIFEGVKEGRVRVVRHVACVMVREGASRGGDTVVTRAL